MLQYHDHKIRVFSLCLLMLSLFPIATTAADEVEALVIAKIVDESETISGIRFEEYDSDAGFTLSSFARGSHLSVKPGNYYISYVIPHFSNVHPMHFDKPEAKEHTFSVIKGSIVYWGVWDFKYKKIGYRPSWSFDRSYPDTVILDLLEKQPNLVDYPLMVSTQNGLLVDVPWDKFLSATNKDTD